MTHSWLLLLLLAASSHALLGRFLKARNAAPPVVAMDETIDPKLCMGTWYVQRQKPALGLLENGARNGVEQYDYDGEGDGFSVQYTLNRKGAGDAVTTVRQRGRFASEKGTRWEVAPLIGRWKPPLRLPFVILDVDPDRYMVCTGGLKSWMYVMTRERQPDPSLIKACMATVEAAGFDMSKVQVMEHD